MKSSQLDMFSSFNQILDNAIHKGYNSYGNWEILMDRMITDAARNTAMVIEMALMQQWLWEKHKIYVNHMWRSYAKEQDFGIYVKAPKGEINTVAPGKKAPVFFSTVDPQPTPGAAMLLAIHHGITFIK